MSFFGGGRSSAPAPPSQQTTFVREAPGIEERKIELMDIARQVAQKPIDLPDIQAAGPSALEQLGFQQAARTGVGAGTVQQGIAQIQGAAAPIGAQQIAQYLNPYQSYVTDEIARQAQMMGNRLGAQAIGAGAFGGGREGVQQAELQGQSFDSYGSSSSTRFQHSFRRSTKTTTNWVGCRATIRSVRCRSTTNGTSRSTTTNGCRRSTKTTSTTSIRCTKSNYITTTIRALSKSRIFS